MTKEVAPEWDEFPPGLIKEELVESTTWPELENGNRTWGHPDEAKEEMLKVEEPGGDGFTPSKIKE